MGVVQTNVIVKRNVSYLVDSQFFTTPKPNYLWLRPRDKWNRESTSVKFATRIDIGIRTEWSPIMSIIIRVINKIERPRSGSLIC